MCFGAPGGSGCYCRNEKDSCFGPLVLLESQPLLATSLRLLHAGPIWPRGFPLTALPETMEASATAGSLECALIQP
jgi:hypothetical protein